MKLSGYGQRFFLAVELINWSWPDKVKMWGWNDQSPNKSVAHVGRFLVNVPAPSLAVLVGGDNPRSVNVVKHSSQTHRVSFFSFFFISCARHGRSLQRARLRGGGADVLVGSPVRVPPKLLPHSQCRHGCNPRPDKEELSQAGRQIPPR